MRIATASVSTKADSTSGCTKVVLRRGMAQYHTVQYRAHGSTVPLFGTVTCTVAVQRSVPLQGTVPCRREVRALSAAPGTSIRACQY
eukprot:1283320-Rhodomonas_salina.1